MSRIPRFLASAGGGAVALSCFLVAPTAACGVAGSGTSRSQPRTAKGTFDEVVVEDEVDLRIAVGGAPSVRVDCDENLLPLLQTEVRGTTLRLGVDGHRDIDPKGKCEVVVSMPELVRLTRDGAGSATVTGSARGLREVRLKGAGKVHLDEIRTDRVRFEISGAGDLRVDRVAAKAVVLGISGAGDVSLAGATDTLEVHASGQSEVRAKALAAQSAEVDVSGAGAIDVAAQKSVAVDVSGVANVTVAGNPPKRSVNVSGLGHVRFD